MATDMKPRVLRKGKQLQLCYDLPQRVNVAKIYPKTAPNGSTVVIYGHSNGLRVIWRGGRSLKRKSASTGDSQPKVNGTSNDAVMVDLTDDEPSQAPPTIIDDDVEFESEEEEEDEAEPYPPVVQHLDLPLGTEVLYMSFPQVPSISPYRPANLIPPIFNERIVLSVACADSSVRVVTLPLTPPSQARKAAERSKSKALYGEQVLRIEGQHGHQSIPRGITMTWSSRTSDTFPEDINMDADASDDDDDTESLRSRRLIQSDEPLEWDLIVASHSVEVTGLLHIFRIPLVLKDNQFSFTTDPIFPWQTQYLSAPATRVHFSSSQFPSPRHLQLLVADSKGSVKIYDPLAPPRARPRSAGRDVVIEPKPGAWIASFSTSFEVPKHIKVSNPYLARRKAILDAKWASDGKSIVALLSDGEWGVWALDGASTARNASTKPVSTFALRGYVSSSEPKASAATNLAQAKPSNKSLTLAPMTPNTRRTREDTLFHGPITPNTTDSSHGGISISSSFSPSNGQAEDSIVLFYGDDMYRIPNLQQFWGRSTHSTGSGSLYGPGLTRVEGASLYGEPVTDVEQFGKPKGAAARMGVPRDLLVVGERRIVVLATISPEAKTGGNLFAKDLDATDRPDRIDQDLLKRGELDIGGMDRLLDSMASGPGAAGGPQGPLRLGNGPAAQNVRRVGFAGLSSLGSSR
ncbi:Nucleoporin NUP37 [Lasiodiplodia theobromae]|uniref:Nucleoporin NUP37 n=1 Tax=Lasiodiplodia theobromae TaxID=45133 RepID=A0A5N5DGT3_9PEZI|nr:Nucleoporin NUP37 [Lasiodiplodia theobromae]